MNHRPRILDLFSGAGGAGFGYAAAGFDVTGVDLAPMPRYPYTFIQADALEYLEQHGHEYDCVHASPPCQDYTVMKAFVKHDYPRLIAPVRELLIQLGKPYVIENVEGARSELRQPITLCGSMFPELRVYRHRLFESNVRLIPPYFCDGKHNDNTPPAGSGKSSKGYISITGGGIRGVSQAERRAAMGIDWMTNDEMNESFPPQYTHWIGCQLMQQLGLTPLSWPITRAVQTRLFA